MEKPLANKIQMINSTGEQLGSRVFEYWWHSHASVCLPVLSDLTKIVEDPSTNIYSTK